MTDSSFCRVVKSLASPIVFREMVSSEAIVRDNEKTKEMTEIHESERPIIQQIFGSDPATMAEAARRIVESVNPEGIDVNMGCPVYKITSNFNGAALMKEPDRATAIVRALKAAVNVPVSIKIRAGWSRYDECIEFAQRLESAGADLITVHGRTKEQGYAGLSNREAVAEVKKVVQIPVLYNGDVFIWSDFFAALEQTKCDGVLIARGGLGNPWIFKQIEAALTSQPPEYVSFHERLRVIKFHLALHLEQYGPRSVTTFRKHLSWYFKGQPGIKQFKEQLMTAPNQETLAIIFDKIEANQNLYVA
jgi:tRNA-dihydrouridine synthase B